MEDAKRLFGRKLKEAREARGYTQKALGALIGIDPNSLARLERGEQGARWRVMEKIFEVIDEPPTYYFSDQPSALSQAQAKLVALTRGLNKAEMSILFDDLGFIHKRRARLSLVKKEEDDEFS